ncbi:hypothetical protein BD410DRAFT_783119 [Rickenella mellea]|uniref:Uncharacterized protein n=1 Tax=Rickenella mellea TaxID=50990 RepID=A0A4Y7QIQ6_9AGAM|nr:hypothetical protein BD410DRAFT_783119 [Rickenella mellea]
MRRYPGLRSSDLGSVLFFGVTWISSLYVSEEMSSPFRSVSVPVGGVDSAWTIFRKPSNRIPGYVMWTSNVSSQTAHYRLKLNQ